MHLWAIRGQKSGFSHIGRMGWFIGQCQYLKNAKYLVTGAKSYIIFVDSMYFSSILQKWCSGQSMLKSNKAKYSWLMFINWAPKGELIGCCSSISTISCELKPVHNLVVNANLFKHLPSAGGLSIRRGFWGHRLIIAGVKIYCGY